MPTEERKSYFAQPLQFAFDLQLGSDGYPWIRFQLATTAMTMSFLFPVDSAEDVIANISAGIRKAVRNATKKQADTTMPDFTGIKVVNR